MNVCVISILKRGDISTRHVPRAILCKFCTKLNFEVPDEEQLIFQEQNGTQQVAYMSVQPILNYEEHHETVGDAISHITPELPLEAGQSDSNLEHDDVRHYLLFVVSHSSAVLLGPSSISSRVTT